MQIQPTDEALAQAVRDGELDAFRQLFERHRDVAERVARSRLPEADVDDVVSEALLAVFVQLRAGAGPTTDVRAYLARVVVNEANRRHRAARRTVADEEISGLLPPSPDHAGPWFESTTVVNAYRGLPRRFRRVLWQVDVEGRAVRDVAEAESVTPGAVSMTLHRARRALRRAYLAECLGPVDVAAPQCRPIRELLPGDVRGSLSRRQSELVRAHLTSCDECQDARIDLVRLDQQLDGWFLPVSVATGAGLGTVGAALSGLAGLVALPLLGMATVGLVVGAIVWGGPVGSAEAESPSRASTNEPELLDERQSSRSSTADRSETVDGVSGALSSEHAAPTPGGDIGVPPPAPALQPEADWTKHGPQVGDRFRGGTSDLYEVRHVERETESSRGEDRDVDPPTEPSPDAVVWEREYEEVVVTRSTIDLAIPDEAQRWETLCDGTVRERTMRAVVEETVTTLHRIGHRIDASGQRVEVRETKEVDRTFFIGAVLGNPPVECLPEQAAPTP